MILKSARITISQSYQIYSRHIFENITQAHAFKVIHMKMSNIVLQTRLLLCHGQHLKNMHLTISTQKFVTAPQNVK